MFPNIFFPKGWSHIYSIEKFFGIFPFEVNLALFPTMYFQCPVWAPVSICLSCGLLWWDHSPRHYPFDCKLSIRHSARESPAISERVWWAGVCCRSVRLAMKLVVFSWVHCCIQLEDILPTTQAGWSVLTPLYAPVMIRKDLRWFQEVEIVHFRTEKLLRGWFGGCQ